MTSRHGKFTCKSEQNYPFPKHVIFLLKNIHWIRRVVTQSAWTRLCQKDCKQADTLPRRSCVWKYRSSRLTTWKFQYIFKYEENDLKHGNYICKWKQKINLLFENVGIRLNLSQLFILLLFKARGIFRGDFEIYALVPIDVFDTSGVYICK